MWSLVAIANWSAISIHHVDYSRRRILMWVPSTPHRHFTTPAHLPHVSTACCLFLLLPLPSTTLQFSARQIAISAFYRWWLWPYPRCPPPSIFKRIEKEGGGWWSVAFRFIRMSYPFFTPLRGQSRSLAIHTCDVTETHPQWLEKRWSGLYTRREKQKKIVKIDAKETRVSITLPQQKREGIEREKKLREE